MGWWEDYFDEIYARVCKHIGLEDEGRIKREVDFIEKALGLKEGMKVLDVGCGQGRHAVELALRGYEVVGLDYSRYLLDLAEKRASNRGVSVRLIYGDMRIMDFREEFDAAFLFYTTFGFFSDEENFRVLGNVSKVLRRDGRLMLDTNNPFRVLDNLESRSWLVLEDGSVYLEELNLNPETMRVEVRIRFVDGKCEVINRRRSVRIYTPAELIFLMGQVGVEKVSVYGDYDLSPFSRRSKRMVIVGRKV